MAKPSPRKNYDKHWLDPPEWWKKWKPLRWIAVFTIIGGAASGLWSGVKLVMEPEAHPATAEYTAVAKARVSLMGDFKSYDSVSEIAAELGPGGYDPMRKMNHRMPNPEFPPRDLDTLTVMNYKHLGVEGELTLKFFNDRLYEAEFSPKSAEDYAAPLRKAVPGFRRDRLGKVEITNGSMRIASNVDLARSPVGMSLRTKPYAIWQDMRLVKQRNTWDATYGSIPYKSK